MPNDLAIAAAIAGMSVGTYLTRAGGYWLMSYVRVSQRVERLLRHLAGSVFVAIVLGGAVKGDAIASAAIGASVVVMALTRKAPLAVVTGVGVAAGWRAFTGQ